MSDITEQGAVWSLVDAEIGIVTENAIAWHDVLYARGVNADPQTTTLTFEGDDTSTDIDELNKVNLELAADKWDFDLIQIVFGKSKVTTIAGEDWGMYFGDDTEIAGKRVALRYTLKARDEVGNTLYTVRYYWLNGTVKMVRPQTAEWKAKHRQVLNFSFEKAIKDIAGVALPGVPSGGAYFRVSRLTAAA